VQSFGLDTIVLPLVSVVALSIIRCSQSAQKFAVGVCKVDTVVMHKRGLCRHAVSVCLSVCLSRS